MQWTGGQAHKHTDIIVMKEGVIIEQGNSDQIISSPKEDYTKSLLAASPKPPKLPKAS